MKTFRFIDIIIQVIILCFTTFLFAVEHEREWIFGFIGLWQLCSAFVFSWRYANKILRYIYLALLLLVFSPSFHCGLEISDNFYWNYICPIVAIYYLIICIVELNALQKKSNTIFQDEISN
jgi:hypothetical protein